MGLDGINSGVSILQPYSASEGNRWFEGTSHAIYQNIDYIDSVNPEYVLILSGDHIYKMDYDAMLQSHKDNNASLTVAVLDVPLKEASRFGIMIQMQITALLNLKRNQPNLNLPKPLWGFTSLIGNVSAIC